ncbi:MAG: response regulator [bacterium]|nr:response regulator [bacterium]
MIKLLREPRLLARLLLIELTCLIALMLVTIYTLRSQALASDHLSEAINLHHTSAQLADQLRHSSDDLTRMVRTYAATGDSRYEQYFYTILNIRDGKVPRPEHYNRIFWDFKVAEETPFRNEDGKKKSLNALMKDAGFAAGEFDLLAEAKRRSDTLVRMEEVAMNAMKGRFKDSKGAFTIIKDPDRELAMQILFSKEYHQAKNDIMEPINKFLIVSENRTSEALLVAQKENRSISLALTILFCCFGIMLPLFVFTGHRYHRASQFDLRQSEERFRRAVVGAPFPIMIHAEGGEVIQISNAWTELTGYELNEISTISDWTERAYGDRQATALEYIDSLYDLNTQVDQGEWCVRTKSGNEIVWRLRSAPLGQLPDGRRLVTTMGMDVTAGKQAAKQRLNLERQLQHAQKLESLGVLAGGIAHDFNNLLVAIMGNADLAMYELSPHAPARENIQEVLNASKRAAELAKQMLAYSGKGRFVIEPISLNKFVEEMAHLLDISISKKAVIKYNFTDDLPTFDGDAAQIRQIIMNLITNASEAIGDKSGVIALSTDMMNCDRAYLDGLDEILLAGLSEPLSEGLYVYFEVADTGCGMDTETIEKMFDPFFTTKFTGRGLGMAAVLGIVHGHGGGIKIYSEPGKGTTLKILFPAKSPGNATAIQQQHTSEDEAWCGHGTILLVDDEETVLTVGKQMLEKMGFDVLTACDGRKAIEVFEAHSDDIVCVLLDLTMPHLNGEAAFRELRRLRSDIAVILCSGYNEQDATQRFAGKGLAGFVQKPYSIAILKEKLIHVLGHAIRGHIDEQDTT